MFSTEGTRHQAPALPERSVEPLHSAAPVEGEACDIGSRDLGRQAPSIEGRPLELDGIPTHPFRIRDDLDISLLAGATSRLATWLKSAPVVSTVTA